MAKKNSFANGAVVMNDDEQFLCTENGTDLFWEADTEHAICFPTNNEAEDFLNKWNREHPRCILNGVRIVESTCNCGGTTRTPICEEKETEVDADMVKLAIKTMKETDWETIEELQGEVAEIQKTIDEVDEQIEDLEDEKKDLEEEKEAKLREIEKVRKDVERALSSVFSKEAIKSILKQF